MCTLTLRKCVVASSCLVGSVVLIMSSHWGIFCSRCYTRNAMCQWPHTAHAASQPASCCPPRADRQGRPMPSVARQSCASAEASLRASPCEYAGHAADGAPCGRERKNKREKTECSAAALSTQRAVVYGGAITPGTSWHTRYESERPVANENVWSSLKEPRPRAHVSGRDVATRSRTKRPRLTAAQPRHACGAHRRRPSPS